MEAKDVLRSLRKERGLSQEELAEKIFVTRQAVSRWETGETLPTPETLQLLSALYDVSINTLLGSPRKLVCQCCGMPLEDSVLSREPDGSLNEEYCKWCYTEGKFAYSSLEELLGQHRTIAEASAVESPIRQETIGFPAHFFARAHNFKPPGRACQPEADSPTRI